MSDKKDKPSFDEQTLDRLLEAAFVLQEHNRRLKEMELHIEPNAELKEPEPVAPAPELGATFDEKSTPAPDYTFTLGQIVEIQHQIQLRRLGLDEAMSLITTRVTEIASANGSGIGILENKEVHYRAASGEMALPVQTSVAMEKALCVASLRTGQVIRCPDVNTEFLLDAEECQKRGIQSLIAVPIYHDGGIAGSLEVYYGRSQAFSEQDIHTCQLMAGLVTEALARNEEETWKKSLAAERAVMLQALETVKPSLVAAMHGKTKSSPGNEEDVDVEPAFICRKCGHGLMEEEQFCGKCGTARETARSEAGLPGEVQSLLTQAANHPVQDQMASPSAVAHDGVGGKLSEDPLAEFLTPSLSSMDDSATTEGVDSAEKNDNDSDKVAPAAVQDEGPAHSIVVRDAALDWSSASAARQYLEQLALEPTGAFARFWAARRGDIYLAVAIVLVACVIRWGIWSDHSVTATSNPTAAALHRKAPDADLSPFDRLLIKLGLAEAPEPPEYKGNPDTQVWIDLQTALYYCPGSDLYGKTPKGKYSSQRDAQLDSYEPALRKACN
ncbi:MAG TPA: GAF domain-containing protein [Verrucomicrobiae bacterium]|nr:GAF domain-containing protein [Verrucomicrobiae bacterium]